MSEQQRRETFGVAYRILCNAFPERKLRRQMYEVWGECEQLINHIEAAQDKYEDLKRTGYDVQDSALDTLLADASWYVRVVLERSGQVRTLYADCSLFQVLWGDMRITGGRETW